jgi:hypothetical protein
MKSAPSPENRRLTRNFLLEREGEFRPETGRLKEADTSISAAVAQLAQTSMPGNSGHVTSPSVLG